MSVTDYIVVLVSAHFELLIGYVVCVLFPIPYLNSSIINLWAKLFQSRRPPEPPYTN